MSLETIVGSKKYRQDPLNPSMVQVQHKHGARWVDYAPRDTPKDAKELIWKIANGAAPARRGDSGTVEQEPKS